LARLKPDLLEDQKEVKPAPAFAGNPASETDQLGGKIRFENILLNQQMQRLMRQHGLTAVNAEVLAPFVFGERVLP
jgi:hypothetical protein